MAPPADEYPYRVIPTISNCKGLYSAVKFFWLPSKHTHTHHFDSVLTGSGAFPLEGCVAALGISFEAPHDTWHILCTLRFTEM
jgi:hypothetical protein